VKPEEVFVFSTGVIGVELPMTLIKQGVEQIELSDDGGNSLARAMMTTDTHTKEAAVTVNVGGKEINISGVAKGSGMIHPNMATMLCFVATDAAVEQDFLRSILPDIADSTLNMLDIDGDTSTNDSLVVLANGAAGNAAISAGSADADTFRDALMELLKRFLGKEEDRLVRNGIRLLGLGNLDELPSSVLRQLRQTEEASSAGDRMTLRLALSYGGRQELVLAMRALAEKVAAGEITPKELDEVALSGHLHHPGMPDPDLVIRTAGEQRLSNFLLWQASYAELHFTPTLWPDFRRQDLLLALQDYHGRVRRFGGIPKEEVSPLVTEE
jgi:undecaprenyl diphosphate synthase